MPFACKILGIPGEPSFTVSPELALELLKEGIIIRTSQVSVCILVPGEDDNLYAYIRKRFL